MTTDGWCPQLQLTLITARQRIRSVSMPLLLCHRCSFLFWLAQHKFIGYFFVQKKRWRSFMLKKTVTLLCFLSTQCFQLEYYNRLAIKTVIHSKLYKMSLIWMINVSFRHYIFTKSFNFYANLNENLQLCWWLLCFLNNVNILYSCSINSVKYMIIFLPMWYESN